MFSFAPSHREAQCYQLGLEKPLRASSRSPATPASATSHHRHAVGAPGRTLGASGQSCTLYPAHLPGGLSGLLQSRPLPAFSDSKVDILPRTFPPNQSAWRRRLALWCLTYMQNRAVDVEGGLLGMARTRRELPHLLALCRRLRIPRKLRPCTTPNCQTCSLKSPRND